MRHDRGADDADGQVERAGLLQPLQAGYKAYRHAQPVGLRHGQLDDEAAGNGGHQPQHNRFDAPKTRTLQAQHQQRVKRGDRNAHRNRHAQQQMQCQRAAQHLGQVAGHNGNFSAHPQKAADPGRVMRAAGTGQVGLRHDAQAHAQGLQQHGGQAGQQHDKQQAVAKARAGFDVGSPVARVHVADRHQQAGTGETQQLFMKR